MPKYWRKQIFTHGRFPELGQKQKTERERRGGERERLNDGNNNGQATDGARKPTLFPSKYLEKAEDPF